MEVLTTGLIIPSSTNGILLDYKITLIVNL